MGAGGDGDGGAGEVKGWGDGTAAFEGAGGLDHAGGGGFLGRGDRGDEGGDVDGGIGERGKPRWQCGWRESR